MTSPTRPLPRAAGVTLVELMVATAITAIITLLATQTFIAFIRGDAHRRKVADVQGGARLALDVVERELRQASLGAGTGRIWTASGSNRVTRPAVQIFSGIPGTGTIDLEEVSPSFGAPKAGTDALLVVAAVGGARAATVGELTGSTSTVSLTTATTTWDGVDHTFTAGDAVLVGDYLDATWAVLESVNGSVTPPQITATADLMMPGTQIPRLPSGAVVRRARARLYYVDVRDQLVRLDLRVPRAPAATTEIAGGEVLATGIENVQVGCELANADGTLGACGGALASGHEIAAESEAFFGAFDAGAGPVLVDGTSLRTIVFNVAARSTTPLLDTNGDASGTLDDEPAPVPVGEGADAAAAYVRRTYQLTAGIRNTSLGAL